jgi:hypothetical protein
MLFLWPESVKNALLWQISQKKQSALLDNLNVVVHLFPQKEQSTILDAYKEQQNLVYEQRISK